MDKSAATWAKMKADEESGLLLPPAAAACKDLVTVGGLTRLVTALILFMAGLVIGLSLSANVTKYYYSQTELFFPSASGAFCDHDCLAFKAFVHPQHLGGHTMTDDELFWRATLVPRTEKFPFQRVPKVAFMFLTRGPLPFAELWDRFFKGHEGLFSVYVHALPEYRLNVSHTSAFYGRQIPSADVSWGSITLVDAEKRLLANALLDFSNERFVLLSESCIPLFNFATVYEYLINAAHSHVESYNINTQECNGRYNRRMAPQIMPAQWRKGAEWFEISRDLAIDVVADKKYYDIFSKFCRPSCYPDEHYIPTFLHMFRGEMNANRTLTWVDWSRGGPHPARYGPENVTAAFLRSLRESNESCMYNGKETKRCYLFARKFSPSALEPLLNLTSTVMEF